MQAPELSQKMPSLPVWGGSRVCVTGRADARPSPEARRLSHFEHRIPYGKEATGNFARQGGRAVPALCRRGPAYAKASSYAPLRRIKRRPGVGAPRIRCAYNRHEKLVALSKMPMLPVTASLSLPLASPTYWHLLTLSNLLTLGSPARLTALSTHR